MNKHNDDVLMEVLKVEKNVLGLKFHFVGSVWPLVITPHTATQLFMHFMRKEIIPVNVVKIGVRMYKNKGLM